MAPDWPYPFWIAHRGGGNRAPENTPQAFRTGLRWGWRMMECDVKLSADDVPYLMHDDTLDRTTDGQGPADALPWPALRQLDAGSGHSAWFRRSRPASLLDVSQVVQAGGACINLEIKPMPGQGARTGAVVARDAARLWRHAAVPPLLSSFDGDALDAARAEAPALPRALLLDRDVGAGVDAALRLGCQALAPRHDLVDATLMRSTRRAGLRVICYTVNDAEEARRLLALGVDGLITDEIAGFDPSVDPRAAGTIQLR